jgi:hypothetical protein
MNTARAVQLAADVTPLGIQITKIRFEDESIVISLLVKGSEYSILFPKTEEVSLSRLLDEVERCSKP